MLLRYRLCAAVPPLILGTVLIAVGAPQDAGAGPREPVRQIGSERQLFVDRWLIDRLRGAELRMHEPVRREVAFRFDAPWEGRQSAYVTLLRDGDRYRMYYRGGGDLTREFTCMAESPDGIRWTRPSLGLHVYAGSRENNILLAPRDKAYAEAHNFTPFRDENPDAAPAERYKAVALGKFFDPKINDRRKMLVAYTSADGIHWKPLQEGPILSEGSFDSQNVAFWDTVRQQYVCYSRGGRDGIRSILRSTSPDFRHWSAQEWIDLGKTPREHFYTNAIAPYDRSPGLFLGFPMRFVPTRKEIGADRRPVDALSDAVLISSRDGVRWERTFMDAFLRPGPDPANWGDGHGNNTPAWGLLPTAAGELSFYWSENYGTVPRLRRGTLRTDGFVSVHGGYAGGELVTRPFRFLGGKLQLNYATSAAGTVRVEVQDASGKPVPGYALKDAVELYGDELERTAGWNAGTDLRRLAGRTVRLRILLNDADLYSLAFSP